MGFMKDKEKQIEEMGKVMPEKIKDPLDNSRYIIFGKSLRREIARIYYNAGYRKLPEDSVVLSREDMKKYAKDCIAGEETGLDIINALIARAERYKEKAKQERKETAEKILKYIEENFEWLQIDEVYDIHEFIANQFGLEIKE